MARAALQIGVRELAEMAEVSPMTITRFENRHSGGHAATLRKLQAALEARGKSNSPMASRPVYASSRAK